jgi:hypothetical protein
MPLRAFLLFLRVLLQSVPVSASDDVAMPLRAFLLFLRGFVALIAAAALLSQCPSGHFCYFYVCYSSPCRCRHRMTSQCPSGHFCYFYQAGDERISRWKTKAVSQCPSGHFCYFYVSTSEDT